MAGEGTVATTDTAAAIAVLDALRAAGVPFAVAHREADIAAGAVRSDVDTVVGWPPREVLRLLLRTRPAGLRPIAAWPYDVGALTVFLVDATLRRGVQLDLLHDARGRGRYGLRTGVALAAAQPGVRWPRLAEVDERLYLLSKRTIKGDAAAVDGLRRLEVDRRRAAELLSSRVWRRIDRGARPRSSLATAPHLLRRLLRPVGVWVEVRGGAGLRAELAGRCAMLLPRVEVSPGPPAPQRVALARRRMELLLSGPPAWWRTPDVVVTAADVDAAACELTAALEVLLVRRWCW